MLGVGECTCTVCSYRYRVMLSLSLLLQLFARGGYSVTLFDVAADQLQSALAAVEGQLKMLEGDGLLREGQTAAELIKSVSVCSDLCEAMKGTIYVQVSVESTPKVKASIANGKTCRN